MVDCQALSPSWPPRTDFIGIFDHATRNISGVQQPTEQHEEFLALMGLLAIRRYGSRGNSLIAEEVSPVVRTAFSEMPRISRNVVDDLGAGFAIAQVIVGDQQVDAMPCSTCCNASASEPTGVTW